MYQCPLSRDQAGWSDMPGALVREMCCRNFMKCDGSYHKEGMYLLRPCRASVTRKKTVFDRQVPRVCQDGCRKQFQPSERRCIHSLMAA